MLFISLGLLLSSSTGGKISSKGERYITGPTSTLPMRTLQAEDRKRSASMGEGNENKSNQAATGSQKSAPSRDATKTTGEATAG